MKVVKIADWVAREEANKGVFDYFMVTLSISLNKNAQKLNEIGKTLEKKENCSKEKFVHQVFTVTLHYYIEKCLWTFPNE